jgi:hypothetical protein
LIEVSAAHITRFFFVAVFILLSFSPQLALQLSRSGLP